MTGDAAPPAPVPRLDELPMAENRTAAYAILREAGPVARTPRRRAYMITSSEAVEFVLKHPGLFSSQQASDAAGSPLPMVPSPLTRPSAAAAARRHRRPARPAAGGRQRRAAQRR
jgi:hypothetical protein